jgi:predicted transcriptional regulator
LYEQMGFTAELAKLQAHQELSSEQKQQAIAKFLKEQMSVSEPLQEKVKKALEEKYKGNQKKIDKIFSRAISKKIQAQTAYVKRMTNKNCVELIQKMNLTDSHAVISTAQEVQKVVRDNIKFNLLLGGLGCIGLISLAISFIPGSIFVTLSTILSLIPAAFFSISGINDLICSLQNNKEGTYDRLLLIATGCVGIVTSTILYALAENPLVKVTAALLALVWLALLYYVSLHLESHTEKAKACFV